MSTAAEEIIGVAQAQARPGVPYGRIENGAIVPLQRQRRASDAYASYEALAEEVAAAMDRRYGPGNEFGNPVIPEFLRRVYRNADGVWVRVVGSHTGETHEEKDAAGKVVATYAARIWVERAVSLSKDAARNSTDIEMDWFQPGKGWVRRGVKREWEDELNVGNQARQRVQWEPIANSSPSPSTGRPGAPQGAPVPRAATALQDALVGQVTDQTVVDPNAFEDGPPPMQQPLRKGK
jgi:hypothetical protein